MADSIFIWPGSSGGGGTFTGQSIGPAADNTAAPPFTFLGDLTTGYASSAVGTLSLVTAGTTRLSLNSTGATFAANVIGAFSRTALATTSADGLTLTNATAATGGATVQMSPRFRLRGNAWDTAASETVDFFQEVLPATAATPTGRLNFWYSLNGAAASQVLALTSTGQIGIYTNDGLTGLNLNKDAVLTWSSTADPFGSADCGIKRLSGAIKATDGGGGFGTFTAKTYNTSGAGNASSYTLNGANGQSVALLELSELTTIAAAATTDTTIQMPAGAIVLAVNTRVTTVIPTATTFTVGDSGSAARFSTAAVSTAANSTDAGTKAGAYYNASALSVRITPDLTPANNTGRVRVTIVYLLSTPPTS